MLVINSSAQLQEAFGAPSSLIFVHFTWSGQSFASLRVFEELEVGLRDHPKGPIFYRFNPDEHQELAVWLCDEKFGDLSGRGFGSVIWLRSGKVVDFEYYGAKAGLTSLLERTRKAVSDPP
jgi:hypothetical protein